MEVEGPPKFPSPNSHTPHGTPAQFGSDDGVVYVNPAWIDEMLSFAIPMSIGCG